MDTKKKEIDIIREMCEANGLKIYTVFREAGVPVNTIGNWDKKEPDAFTVKEKIYSTIEKMVQDKESLEETMTELDTI